MEDNLTFLLNKSIIIMLLILIWQIMDANELQAWRKKLGLTQIAASGMLGVSRVTIQNWEAGAKIPVAIEALCELHEKRWKMRPEYGPVTLIWGDASFWQPAYGPAIVPKLSKELYPDNQSALSRICTLLREQNAIHNPLIIDESGEIIWTSAQIIEECAKRSSFTVEPFSVSFPQINQRAEGFFVIETLPDGGTVKHGIDAAGNPFSSEARAQAWIAAKT